MMQEYLMEILTATVGTLGFALCFHVRRRNLVAATAGGLLAWVFYLAVFQLVQSVFFASMISAMLICTWAEIMARCMKAPATIFLIPGIIPLLPGGSLYRTMAALLEKDLPVFTQRGVETAVITMGISAGLVVASILFTYVLELVVRARRFRAGHSGKNSAQ